jgi:FG-GAP repeat
MTSFFRLCVAAPLFGLAAWLSACAGDAASPLRADLFSVVTHEGLGLPAVLGLAPAADTDPIHLIASDAQAGDVYGAAVALSRDGSTLAVGADQKGSGSGVVHVYARTPQGWVQRARLEATEPSVGGGFGFSLSLSDDGRRLAVGAPFETRAAAEQGAVYVFEQRDSAWVGSAHLKSANARESDWFGASVALSGQGDALAVGARHEDGPTAMPVTDSGAVYVFGWHAGGWSEQDYLKARNPKVGDRFGVSLALSLDGTTLAVGAQSSERGAVSVFKRQSSGWGEQAVLQPREAVPGDGFGAQLALSAQGDTLAIGAAGDSGLAGAAHVYTHRGGRWQQQARLRAPPSQPGDAFGERLALSADGSVLAVSAVHGLHAREAGAVHVFARGTTSWSPQRRLTPTSPGTGDLFGSSLALSGDGRLVAVGARLEDGPRPWSLGNLRLGERAENTGAVYLHTAL